MSRKFNRGDPSRFLRAIAQTGLFSAIVGVLWPHPAAVAIPTPYISNEVGFNNAASRSQVDAQDDVWRSAATAAGAVEFSQNTIPPGQNNDPISANGYVLMTTASGITVKVSLHDVTDADIANPSSLGMLVSGSPRLNNTSTLQEDAPRPASFYNTSAQPRFWNENIGAATSRNAVLFEFSEPVTAFGAWFADMETRTDGNGTPAILRLLDEAGNRIGEDIIISASTPDQSQCGVPSAAFPNSDNTFRGCGNRTTRWIGFVDPDSQVKQMLVVVGDDDFGEIGDREHLSFIGATLAEKPEANWGPPFVCDGELILAQRDPSEFFQVNTSMGTLDPLSFPTIAPYFINAIGFNIQDGYIYGSQRNGNRTANNILRVAADGTVTNMGDPPIATTSAAGDVDRNGVLHIVDRNTNPDRIYKVNVTGLDTATDAGFIELSSNIPGLLDIAFSPWDNNIYSIHRSTDAVYIIEPDSGNVRTVPVMPPGFDIDEAVGAVYFDSFGNFYVYGNATGQIHKIQFDNITSPATATAELFITGNGNLRQNDGTACPYRPRIEKTVDPETTPAGEMVAYTYQITNPNGFPLTLSLSDPLPGSDGRTFTAVVRNPFGGAAQISDDGKTLEIAGLTIPAQTIDTVIVTVDVPANTPATAADTPLLNQARLVGVGSFFSDPVLSDYPNQPGFEDPTPLLVTQLVASDPNLILVKRITAINGVPFTNVVDGRRDLDPNAPTYGDDPTVAYVPAPHDAHDNHPDWPPGYLQGIIDQQVVRPGDEIEYTIYFLSNGDAPARNVRLCDPIPSYVSFLSTSFNGRPGESGVSGADQGIMLSRHSDDVFLTNAVDGDNGAFFTSVSDISIACGATQLEDNGAIVVNLGDIPAAASDPTNAYGFIRFRGRVK